MSHATLDRESRKSKANNITKILSKHKDLQHSVVLDVGTGSGDIAHALSKISKNVTSVDLYDERKNKKGYKFLSVQNEKLPFNKDSFDIVISNHVVEHTPNRKLHLEECMRVLKKDGFLYLATPNKLWMTDPHYNLLFLPWLNRKIADKYVKVFRGSDKVWDVFPTSPKYVKSILGEHKIEPLLSDMLDVLSSKSESLVPQTLNKTPSKIISSFHKIAPTLLYKITKK